MSKYPWSEWTNGETWELTRGRDFDCQAHTMRPRFVAEARKRGMTVTTRITGETISFRFIGPDDPSRGYINHGACDHPRTTAARQKCRRERRKNANPEGESQ